MAVEVGIETGTKRVFAWAVGWPGWCRSGRDAEGAIEALTTYAERFAPVAARAGLTLPDVDDVRVVERVAGDMTTDFGAPGQVAPSDVLRVDQAEAERGAALVRAAWDTLAEVAASAPESLRKGPRGGGRDRDKMLQHVLGAEAAYARKVGVRHREPTLGDDAAVEALRADLLAVLVRPSDGAAPVERGWPTRYAARRVAWHVLDHAWEMQDRSESPG